MQLKSHSVHQKLKFGQKGLNATIEPFYTTVPVKPALEGRLLILSSCLQSSSKGLWVVAKVFRTDWTWWLPLFFGWKTGRNTWKSSVLCCEPGDKILRFMTKTIILLSGIFVLISIVWIIDLIISGSGRPNLLIASPPHIPRGFHFSDTDDSSGSPVLLITPGGTI